MNAQAMNSESVAVAMQALGQAWRGDWSFFDGRSLRVQMDDLAGALRSGEPFDADLWLARWTICRVNQCWAEHCDEKVNSAECAHTKAAFNKRLSGEDEQ